MTVHHANHATSLAVANHAVTKANETKLGRKETASLAVSHKATGHKEAKCKGTGHKEIGRNAMNPAHQPLKVKPAQNLEMAKSVQGPPAAGEVVEAGDVEAEAITPMAKTANHRAKTPTNSLVRPGSSSPASLGSNQRQGRRIPKMLAQMTSQNGLLSSRSQTRARRAS